MSDPTEAVEHDDPLETDAMELLDEQPDEALVVVPEPPASTNGSERVAYSSCEEALEDAVSDLERVTAERDDYLDTARRVQAEFENYRKRVESQRLDQVALAAEAIVIDLLPVLDAGSAALSHGAVDVEPLHSSLLATLTKRGLATVDEVDVTFDPSVHEAVLNEPGDGSEAEPVVTEILRSGYLWNGRVVRPAMVKVRG